MPIEAEQEPSPGGRHTNDHDNFCSISIAPSVDEILCPSAPFLPTRDAEVSYLDRQFRLLRHELVASVIDAIAPLTALRNNTGKSKTPKYTKGGGKSGPPSLLVLAQAKRGAVVYGDDRGAASLLIHFNWPTSHPLSRIKSAQKRLEYVQAKSGKGGCNAGGGAGCNFLQANSLVLVTDKGLNPLFFATIAYQDGTLLAGCDGAVINVEEGVAGESAAGGSCGSSTTGGGERARGGKAGKSDAWRRRQEARPAVGLSFFNREDWEAALLLSRDEAWGCLLPLDTDVSAHECVLKQLQAMGELPMRDLVTDGRAASVLQELGNSPLQNLLRPSETSCAVSHPQPPQPPMYEGAESIAMVQLAEYFARAACSVNDHAPLPSSPLPEDALPAGCHFDISQRMAMAQVLRQRVSLVEGPPGTGKTFLGVCLAKMILSSTSQKILCLCPTVHSLDSLLGGMHDSGITNMVLVDACSQNAKLKPYQMENRPACDLSKAQTRRVANLEEALDGLRSKITQMQRTSNLNRKPATGQVVKWLRLHKRESFEELQEAKKLVGGRGEATVDSADVTTTNASVVQHWLSGNPAPSEPQPMTSTPQEVAEQPSTSTRGVWALGKSARKAAWAEWETGVKREAAKAVARKIEDHQNFARELSDLQLQRDVRRISEARIIGCTTTEAAARHELVTKLRYDVVLVDDAAEVLEAHLLAALKESTRHLIMIGDHKQRRPELEEYNLCVESGNALDLNESLFERLIKSGYPRTTLQLQRRMPFEISALVRGLAYPGLRDGPGTDDWPPIRGIRDRVCFVTHSNRETKAASKTQRKNNERSAPRINLFEVRMVAKTIRYLLLQGYEPDQILVLTPYLAQLRELREATTQVDGSGSVSIDSSSRVRMATIGSYAGEKSDVVICSFVRSKKGGDMGLVADPNRLNFAVSRARHCLILFGDIDFYTSDTAQSESGRNLWLEFAALLEAGGHVYRDGLPVVCEEHKTHADLPTPEAFDENAPGGGCGVVCGAILQCGHPCPRRCHPGFDQPHDLTPCKAVLMDTCAKGHTSKLVCSRDGSGGPCQPCKREEGDAKQEVAVSSDESHHDAPVGEAPVGSAPGRPEGVLGSENPVSETGLMNLDEEEERVKPNAEEGNPYKEALCRNLIGQEAAANAAMLTDALSNASEAAGNAMSAASWPSPQEACENQPSATKTGMYGGSRDDSDQMGDHEGRSASADHGRRSTSVGASLGRTRGLTTSEGSTARDASAAAAAPTASPRAWGNRETGHEVPEVFPAVSPSTPLPPNQVAAMGPRLGETSDATEGPDDESDRSPFLSVEDMYILREACDIAGLPSDSPDLQNLDRNVGADEALRSTLVLGRAEGGIGFSTREAGAFLRKVADDRAALARLQRQAGVAFEKLASDLAHAKDAVEEVDAMVTQAAKEDEDQELLGGTLAEVFAAAELADTIMEGQGEEELLQAAVAEADAAVRKEAMGGGGGEELLALLVQVKQARQRVLDTAREKRATRLATMTNTQEATQQALRRDKEEREAKISLMVKKKWEKIGELNRLKNELATAEASKAVLRRMGACPAGLDWYRQGEGWRCAGGSHYVAGGNVAAEIASGNW